MNNVNFEVWDLGGQANMRPSWGMYLKGVDAVIVVIDSTDRVRIPIAKQELYQILAVPELEKVPLLILANKQVRKRHSRPCVVAGCLTILQTCGRIEHCAMFESISCWLALSDLITTLLQRSKPIHGGDGNGHGVSSCPLPRDQ